MMPFYLFGYYMFPILLKWKDGLWLRVGCAAFLIYVAGVFLGGNFWDNGMAFYTNHIRVYNFEVFDVVMMSLRFGLGTCGILGIMWLARVLMRLMPKIEVLAPLGVLTLGIYFVHRFFIRLLFLAVGQSLDLLVVLAGALFVYVLSFVSVWLSKRLSVVNKVIWGIKIPK